MMPNQRHSGLLVTSIFSVCIVTASLSACTSTDTQPSGQYPTVANEKLAENINEVLAKDESFKNEINLEYIEVQQQRAIESQQQRADAEQRWNKKAQEEMEKEDEKKCQSFGAKLGTQPYIQCRVLLIQLHDLQKQRAEEESQRNANAEGYELQRRDENEALQQQRAYDERRRADEARIQRSMGLLQLGAGLLQSSRTPAPPVPSSQHGYTINGQVHNCNTFGNNTTCY